TGDEGPDRLIVVQASEARQRRARNGATTHCRRNADRHSDRGRQLRRTGQGLNASAIATREAKSSIAIRPKRGLAPTGFFKTTRNNRSLRSAARASKMQ